jgi:hypothetical protein
MALIRVLLPRSLSDPDGNTFRSLIADVARVPITDVVVFVESRTTIVVDGCNEADVERAALSWSRTHLPELEFAWFCGDVRVETIQYSNDDENS